MFFHKTVNVMKRTLLIAFVLAFIVLSSCDDCSNGAPANNNNSEYTTSGGVILGYDYRKCICCGGWWIEIKSDTLRILNMPSDFNNILMDEEMPVSVLLDWKDMEDGCGEASDELIEVKSIQLK